MCHIITKDNDGQRLCPHLPVHLCSTGEFCHGAFFHNFPSSQGWAAYLCELHAHVCIHCGKFYCPACIVAHQGKCAMRPMYPGLWELIEQTLGGMETT